MKKNLIWIKFPINSPEKSSIKKRILLIFILITGLMALGFFISSNKKNIILTKYYKYMNTNIMLSKLPIEINNIEKEIDAFVNKRGEESVERYQRINERMRDLLLKIEEDIWLDKDSSIFFRNLSNMFDYQKELVKEIFDKGLKDSTTYQKWRFLKTLYTYMKNHAQQLTVTYLDYSSNQYYKLLTNYKVVEKKIYLILITFGLGSIIFAFILSKNIFDTIEKLSRVANEMASGNLDVCDLEESRYRELNILAYTFNSMKNNIKKFIQEVRQKSELEITLNRERLKNAEKDKLLKETQLKALQTQINPHFLFNTLNTVGRIAMFEGAKETVLLIEAVSKLLRFNLSIKEKLISLEEEINALKAYIYIQEIRFQDQMKFNLDIEGKIADIKIPPMTLQPIVENAVIHGLADLEKGGYVQINVQRKEKEVEIKVFDNGRGMAKEEINRIIHENQKSKQQGHTTSLGIANVLKRLELCFQRPDLLKIDSTPGSGTLVTIIIPVKEGESDVKGNDC